LFGIELANNKSKVDFCGKGTETLLYN